MPPYEASAPSSRPASRGALVDIGRIGIWTAQFEQGPWSAAAEAAAELDALGYGALWVPESRGREAFAQSALLLGATRRIAVAPGIANIYARDAVTMANGQRALAEAYPGRFLLGLGVSHRPNVETIRGHRYGPPLATMRAYRHRDDERGRAAPARRRGTRTATRLVDAPVLGAGNRERA